MFKKLMFFCLCFVPSPFEECVDSLWFLSTIHVHAMEFLVDSVFYWLLQLSLSGTHHPALPSSQITPQSDLYLVPDIEHTILQVLSFPTLLGLNLAIAKMQAISFQSKAKYAILASLMFCVFPLLFVLFDTLENSLGACFVIVAIILNTSATLLYCKITSSTTKAS